MMQITSLQNPVIKHVVQLQEKAKVRKKSNAFVIEGQREIELAQKGNYAIEMVLFCNEVCKRNYTSRDFPTATVVQISKEVYEKIAYRSSTEGIIAIAKTKSLLLSDLDLSKNPLIMVLEGIEKPGNVGAILRTADAANIDAVILADPKSDVYNPNTIRSSVGCLFTNQIATGTSAEVIAFLKEKKITFYSATLQNATDYHIQDYTTPTALVVGTEATGLTAIWRQESKQNIIIPMQGEIDSMNVSVAAAILLFEAKRQRGF